MDLPTSFEAYFLDSVLGKSIFCTFQIIFYIIRPMFIFRAPVTWIYCLNVVAQGAFDYFVSKQFGTHALYYLFLSSFFAESLHPCAAHFIAEHYVFEGLEKYKDGSISPPETCSYYGPLNLITYNVGLHNEHHDFPAIPWTRLRKLQEIAKDFYVDLPYHKNWIWIMWDFVWDRKVGLYSRVKRNAKAKGSVALKCK